MLIKRGVLLEVIRRLKDIAQRMQQYEQAAYANLLVQLAVAIGFIGTWRAVWKNPSKENSLPWWIWTVSYGIAVVVVLLRWKGSWLELAYPINMGLLHASVPVLATVRKNFFPTTKELRERLLMIRCTLGQPEMRFIPNVRIKLRREEAEIKRKLGAMA